MKSYAPQSSTGKVLVAADAQHFPYDRTDRVVTNIALVYIHLWVLEGAIRKWIPALDTLMYVGRDVLVIGAILLLALSKHRGRRATPVFWLAAALMSLLAVTHVFAGLVGLEVAVVGLRSYLAPALLAYIVWRYEVHGAFARMSWVVISYLPLQLAIVLLQVSSSPSAWINRETSGESASFINAGVVRASGTFTAPAGLALYIPLALALALVIAREVRGVRRAFTALCMGMAVLVVLLAGSRGLLLAAVIVMVTYVAVQLLFARGGFSLTLRTLVAVAVAGALALWLLPTVVDSFLQRFEDASRSEDSGERLVSQTFGFLSQSATPIGSGIGAHSQAGIRAGSGFGWIEVEATRWVAELGAIGILLGILRLVAVVVTVIWLLGRDQRSDVALWMIAAALLPVVAFGQLTQTPSSQGFVSLAVALMIAAVNDRSVRHGPRGKSSARGARGNFA